MASTYIQRVDSANGNRKVWTWSAWVKRDVLGSVDHNMFSMGEASADEGQFKFSSDQLSFFNDYASSGRVSASQPSRKFRDVNGWYHFVWRHKSDESTASDRWKIYINGERLDPSDYGNPSIPNEDGCYNKWENKDMWFGARAKAQNDNSYQYFSGLMSHIHFCDGYAYDASDFGSIDNVTGEWSINTSPNVQYGSKGFFILKDGNSVTDQSGNGNNCTVGGGTLTKTEDNPSNVFCTLNRNIVQAGGVSGRHANVSASLDNGNTTGGEGSGVFSNQLGTIFASSGKYYAECKFGGDQYCHFGVTSPNFSDASLGSYPGNGISGVHSAGIYGNGGIARCNGATIFTDSNITTDTICLAMDLDNGALYIRRNDGSWMNSGNPESGATKTGAITLPSDTYSWIVTSHNNSGSGRNYMKVNFGNGYFGSTQISSAGTNASNNGIFEYDVPTGYTALSTKGLNL